MTIKAQFNEVVRTRTLDDDDPVAHWLLECGGGDPFLLNFVRDHLRPKSKAELYAEGYRLRQRLTDRGYTMDAALDAVVSRYGHLVTNQRTLRAEARKLSGNNPFGKIPNESSPAKDSNSPSPPSTE
jgi:hypothetical protein